MVENERRQGWVAGLGFLLISRRKALNSGDCNHYFYIEGGGGVGGAGSDMLMGPSCAILISFCFPRWKS